MRNKYIFFLILGVILLTPPLDNNSSQFDKEFSNLTSSSLGNPPVITDLGGGIYDLDLYWENYTGNLPWEVTNDFWALYWYAEYTADMDIYYFFYNLTYGSLNGYNGSFTPLYDDGPGVSYDNHMYCFEIANPDRLANFGWEVTVWIEDADGAISDPFTKLFKYYNGTHILPEEELEFTVNTLTPIVNLYENMRFDFEISDPDGPRDYNVEFTCDYANFYEFSYRSISPSGAFFEPRPWSRPAQWDVRVYYNFTFNLSVWEDSVMVDSVIDIGMVYATSPPENGTCIATFDKYDSGIGKYVYNFSCEGWEDELDGDGPFLYRVLVLNEHEIIDDPEYPSGYWHEGSNQTEFQFGIEEKNLGMIWVRVFDSHGGYTEVYIGELGGQPSNNIPGYSIYLLFLSAFPIVAILYWQQKKANRQ